MPLSVLRQQEYKGICLVIFGIVGGVVVEVVVGVDDGVDEHLGKELGSNFEKGTDGNGLLSAHFPSRTTGRRWRLS